MSFNSSAILPPKPRRPARPEAAPETDRNPEMAGSGSEVALIAFVHCCACPKVVAALLNPSTAMANHVIILGAGASYTSGYPMAEELRQLLSGKQEWGRYLARTHLDARISNNYTSALDLTDTMQDEMRLFREGGFATVDEFSKLAQARFPEQVAGMKKLMSVALAVLNPEFVFSPVSRDIKATTTGFATSDYYRFIQKLFLPNLHDFRNDVCVLTFNYDPYLDFLLGRAYKTRKAAAMEEVSEDVLDAISSGFAYRESEHLAQGTGFCFLKLHGTVAVPDTPKNKGFLTHNDIFGRNHESLFRKIQDTKPPLIAFPWEMHVSDEHFEKLVPTKSKPGRSYWAKPGKDNASLFKAIWTRAGREIAEAARISFVGISMHSFLDDGFKRLFEIRRKKVSEGSLVPEPQLVSASPESVLDDLGRGPKASRQTQRILSMAKQFCPSVSTHGIDQRVIAYKDFSEFIDREMR